jgi:hypothetical protein
MTTIFEKNRSHIRNFEKFDSRNSIERRSGFGPFGISRRLSGPALVRTVREEYPDVPEVPEVPEVRYTLDDVDEGDEFPNLSGFNRLKPLKLGKNYIFPQHDGFST